MTDRPDGAAGDPADRDPADRDPTDRDPTGRDLTGRDPLSSTAEGDPDPGSATLAADGPGSEGHEPGFAEVGPPPEAADGKPVTDAAPEKHLEPDDPA